MTIQEYLKQNGMHPDCYDFEKETAAFKTELENGLCAENSLAMIPTYLSTEGSLPPGEPVLVIDAGGTSLRTALVRFTADGPTLEKLTVRPMPGSEKALSLSEYHCAMCEAAEPYLNESRTIGYCFSYTAEILPDHDAILDCFSKGVNVDDSDGMKICSSLDKALHSRGFQGKLRWVLLNDSAAAACGGLPTASREDCDSVIGFILGTGINICCPEKTACLTRHPGAAAFPHKTMLINTEAGAYDKIMPGLFDEKLHETDPQPGMHRFEKMTSGAYLGKLVRLTAAGAAEEGFFSAETSAALRAAAKFTTKECSDFFRHPETSGPLAALCRTETDRDTLKNIIEAIFTRAGKLAAIALRAVIEQTGRGTDPAHPVLILAEGSTFLKAHLIRDTAERLLEVQCRNTGRGFFRICSADNVNLFGSAAAALLNR